MRTHDSIAMPAVGTMGQYSVPHPHKADQLMQLAALVLHTSLPESGIVIEVKYMNGQSRVIQPVMLAATPEEGRWSPLPTTAPAR